jgi:hypothetical protein
VKVESTEKISGRSSQQWEGRKWTTARPPDHQDQLNPGGWDIEGWWEPRAAQNRPRRIGSRQKRKEKQRSGRRKSRGGVESSDLWDSDVWASALTDHTRMIQSWRGSWWTDVDVDNSEWELKNILPRME